MDVRAIVLVVGVMSCTLVPDPAYESGGESASGMPATESSSGTPATESSSGTPATESSSGADESGGGACGNASIDVGEQCDGAQLDDQTCVSQGFAAGSLACGVACDQFDTAGCLACGDSPTPPAGECPMEICSSCDATTCFIDCAGIQVCVGAIECPSGWDCDITCEGEQACQGADIRCDDEHACTVHCAQAQACQGATVGCGAGPCTVECDAVEQECQELSLVCGSNVGQVICEGEQEGVLEPTEFVDGACDCVVDPSCGSTRNRR